LLLCANYYITYRTAKQRKERKGHRTKSEAGQRNTYRAVCDVQYSTVQYLVHTSSPVYTMLNRTSEGMKKKQKHAYSSCLVSSRALLTSTSHSVKIESLSRQSTRAKASPIHHQINHGTSKALFFAPFTPPPLTPPIQRPSERQRRRQRLPLTGRLPHCITLHASGTVQFKYTHPEKERKRGNLTTPSSLPAIHPPVDPIRVPLSPP
jgi:hypothetical protein